MLIYLIRVIRVIRHPPQCTAGTAVEKQSDIAKSRGRCGARVLLHVPSDRENGVWTNQWRQLQEKAVLRRCYDQFGFLVLAYSMHSKRFVMRRAGHAT